MPSSPNQLTLAGISDATSNEASRIATSLAALLSGVSSQQKMALVDFVLSESFRRTQELTTLTEHAIDPQIIEWARQHFDPQEAAANLREIRETGGFTLADFEAELDQLAQE